ncbi:MAG: molybdate ABC transporter substrate-binding protein [Spirulinaceae cyanobacterium]
MNTKKSLQLLGISLITSALTLGCNNTSLPENNLSNVIPTTELTVSVAGSLKDAMEEIKPLYQEEYPDTEIIYNFASSGSLQRQIEQGAPVDVFISAAVGKMDAIEKQGLIDPKTRQNLIKNQLVLIVPTESKNAESIADFKDLTAENIKIIALGESESVPAGQYAQEVLSFFEITAQVNDKAIYGKDVHQILNYVATGNVDAGILYQTDAQSSDYVKIAAKAPDRSHTPIIYPIAVLQDSKNAEAANEFVAFLATPEAQEIFEEHGFVPMTNP